MPFLRNIVFACSVLVPSMAQADTLSVMNPSGFEIHRGTNLSHWLSQDFDWADRTEWITENDIQFIARCGFDHVRLPIDEKEMWNENGSPNEAAFATLKQGLNWCSAAGLRVILDLHTVRAHHFNASNEGGHNTLWTDAEAQKHFVGLWMELSSRMHDYPNDFLAYEIMNEPTAEDPEDWNHVVAITFKAIRSVEPERVIVIGSDKWQMPASFPFLKVPENDRNIILSMHTYSPMALTHHEADWIGEPLRSYTGPVNYPGPVLSRDDFNFLLDQSSPGAEPFLREALEDWNPNRILEEIEPAIKRAKELGLQLYCGEFGCLPSVPRTARLVYYRDIVGVFEANGIAWANWEYKGDFGILEWHGVRSKLMTGAPDSLLLDSLMQR